MSLCLNIHEKTYSYFLPVPITSSCRLQLNASRKAPSKTKLDVSGLSQRVQVKTSPIQNVPYSKRPRIGHMNKKDWSKRPTKRPHISLGVFRRNIEF